MTDPQVIINLGTGGSDLNGQNGSTSSADSNDARFLDWPGDNAGNYVYLPGVDGNYLSVPDEAALDITGDIDVRAYVAADDWTPSSVIFPIGKWDSGNQSWFFRISTNGIPRFFWSTTGSDVLSAVGTVAPNVNDTEALWIRATMDVDNGAGGYDVKFYTSADDGSTWTQLGSTITGGSTTSIYASSQDVEIGSIADGATGGGAYKVYRAQVLDGIDGTTVLDVDTSVITSGSATSFTAVTGQTVTINRSSSGRKSVTVVSPVYLFGTDDYWEVADNALINFDASDDFAVMMTVRVWSTQTSSGRYISKRQSSSLSGWRIYNSGTTTTIATNIADADSDQGTDFSSGYTVGQLTTFGMVIDRSAQTLVSFSDSTVSSTTDISNIGDISNSRPLRIGVRSDSLSAYVDFEVISVAVFRRILTQAEITSLTTYYQNRLS